MLLLPGRAPTLIGIASYILAYIGLSLDDRLATSSFRLFRASLYDLM